MNRVDANRAVPSYQYYAERLRTFETWPKQMIPDKYSLAKYGFIYTGQGDQTRCFRCKLVLKEWERTDLPYREHRRWSPHCDFLNMIGGEHVTHASPSTNNHYFMMRNSDLSPSDRDVRYNRL